MQVEQRSQFWARDVVFWDIYLKLVKLFKPNVASQSMAELPGMDPGLSPGGPRGSWAARIGLQRDPGAPQASPGSLRRTPRATHTGHSTKNTSNAIQCIPNVITGFYPKAHQVAADALQASDPINLTSPQSFPICYRETFGACQMLARDVVQPCSACQKYSHVP